MEAFINSRTGLRMAISLARAVPPSVGNRITKLVAWIITSRPNSTLVKAVRANQWMVSGGKKTGKDLDRDVRTVFEYSARSVYELYHYIRDPENAGTLFTVEDSFQEVLDQRKFDKNGIIATGLHMSGFDLALQWLCTNWTEALGLTIPQPEGGRAMEFEFRKQTRIRMVPGTMTGLREALRYLDQGGIVTTGIDRPIPLNKHQQKPNFFGKPAPLPAHHIFLALKSGAPLILVASRLEADGTYHLTASDPIEMIPYPNREEALLRNAEKVLAVAEDFIRQAPQQWLVPLPVWPDVLEP